MIKRLCSIATVLISFPLVLAFSETKQAQDEKVFKGPSVSLEEIKKVVKEAISEEKDNQIREEEKLITDLKSKITLLSDEWITQSRIKLSGQLNNLTHRNWQDLKEFTAPLPYDFYIRDYSFSVQNSDVVKNDSLLVPYKGIIDIIQKLYIEKPHSSDASDINPFLYTVRTDIRIEADYQGERFVISNINSKDISVLNEWHKN